MCGTSAGKTRRLVVIKRFDSFEDLFSTMAVAVGFYLGLQLGLSKEIPIVAFSCGCLDFPHNYDG